MDFTLEISRNNTDYEFVDLFPDSQLNYDLDFYDNLEIDKIKLPFSSEIKIPLTDTNKGSDRFNYDPFTDQGVDFPKDDFYFRLKVYGSSTTVIEGMLNVRSIEYNSDEPYLDVQLQDFVSKYINDLKNVRMHEIYEAGSEGYENYYKTNQPFSVFFDAVANGGERGTINQNPELRPIIFPYVDFVNDVHGKFGYAARQFTEYGVGLDRAGIVPVFNVKYFLYYLGLYLSDQGFSTSVESKLFGQGYSDAIADFEPAKLHMLLPAKLEADKDVNTRTFNVRQSPFWVGTNTNLFTNKKSSDPTEDKDFVTDWFKANEVFGNYGPDAEGGEQAFASDYGIDITDDPYPEDGVFGYERGYFAPHMSFEADIDFRIGNIASVREIQFEIPVVYEDNMVQNIIPANSDMVFDIFLGVYQDGVLIKKIRVQDSSGDPITLNANEATAAAGNSEKSSHSSSTTHHFFEDNEQGAKYVILEDTAGYTDLLRWNLADLEKDRWEIPDETITINGESRYAVNYFLEPVSGDLNVVYTTDVSTHSNHLLANTLVTADVDISGIKKAITRVPTDYGQLDLKFTANANYNPYFTDDEYNIKESLENTCTISVYDVLLGICKRFNCGIFYEYNSDDNINILRIDPLQIVRSGSENINQYIDDLKSVKVFIGGDKIKNFSLNNKDFDLYYDDQDGDDITIGSTTQEINNDGISDLKIDLETSVYYKSVCGEDTDDKLNQNYVNNVVSEKEIAFTPNLFTRHQEIGFRFAYVDKPIYRTMIKRPRAESKFQRSNLYTKTQRIYQDWTQHIFNGRLFHYNIRNWNLLAEDEDGNTTDYYDFYVDNEKIKYSNSTSIEFDMVVPTSDLGNLDFMMQELSATLITQDNIVVKSASGEVFEDFAYLTIKGLLK